MELLNMKFCTGCSACSSICPNHAIIMAENFEGFLYPQINFKQCVNCRQCVDVCTLDKKIECKQEAYSIVNKNKIIYDHCSTTGIVSVLSKIILHEGGFVVGSCFENGEVKHIIVDNIDDVSKLAGSKYVQSKIGNIFNKIKCILKQNKKVLFVGTPCQVAGLKGFLKREYNNLVTIDFICHGVPSPKVWNAYFKQVTKENNLGEIISVNFRDKEHGWAKYGLRITGTNNEYFSLKEKEPYLLAFLRNITLRKSCFNCKFKGNNRYSDITVGDLWGGQRYSSVFDNTGTGIVTIHTEKGRELLKKNEDNISLESIDFKEYFKYHNKSMIESPKMPGARKWFFREYLKNDNIILTLIKAKQKTDLLYKLYSIKEAIKRRFRRILNAIYG